MNPNDPNIAILERAADVLGETLCQRMVFVGGAVVGLLITDPAQPAIRATDDVDLLVGVLALGDYYQIEELLRERGLSPDASPSAPICRWRHGSLIVDVMPTLGRCWASPTAGTRWPRQRRNRVRFHRGAVSV